MSQNQVAFQGNEAGRAATVATVEQLTGVHIDHFAEVNLDGFYELAKRARRRGGLPQPPGPAMTPTRAFTPIRPATST